MIRGCCLVVNPAAGGGGTGQLLATVRGVLDDAGVAHQICASDSLEHARELPARWPAHSRWSADQISSSGWA